jgi:hypothetical protein
LVELVQVGALVTEDNLKQSDEIEFVQVECLRYNTLALTSEGQLFSCGKGGSDGSGHGDHPHTLLCLINSLDNKTVHNLYSGFGCHVAALVEDQEGLRPYIWGNGDDYRLGNGKEEPVLTPQQLLFDPPRETYMISCGETHCAAILEPLDDDVNPDPSIEFFIESGEEEDTTQSTEPRSVEKKISTNNLKGVPVVEEDDDDDEEEDYDEDEQPMITIHDDSRIESKPDEKPAVSNVATTPRQTTSASSSKSVSSSSSPQTFQPVSGYLNKKGEKGIVKLWRKRWFVMDQNSMTYYDKENGSKKKGQIATKDIVDVLPGQTKHGFNLVARNGRIYELQAMNQDDFSKWTKAVRSVV